MKASLDYIKVKKPLVSLIEQVPHVLRNKKNKADIYDKFIRVPLGPKNGYCISLVALA